VRRLCRYLEKGAIMTDIQKNLIEIEAYIDQFEKKYHRIPNSVTLLAASKKQSLEKIQQAINAGQTIFGENYLQEALPKIDFFKHQNLEWHFIGPIQSNKTKKIAEHFSWVHSVDSIKIAKRLNDQRPPHLPPLNICLEVNISGEPTKSGISSCAEITSLAEYCLSLPQIKLRGLMAIPAATPDFENQREELHRLKLIFDDLLTKKIPLDTLSMGMSDDLEAAIAEGSTLVRIGTRIFGTRI
jgi:pyridoxal phosphate enzyme (YggS family)